MAGVTLKIKGDKEVQALLTGIRQRMRNMTPATKIISSIVRTSVVRNFEKDGRPQKWKPLKASTLRRRKKKTGILVVRGFAGGLMGSIHARAHKDRAIVGTNKIYAAIHHFGGKAGRGRKVLIPARPFMMVQDEDWKEIRKALSDFIILAKRR